MPAWGELPEYRCRRIDHSFEINGDLSKPEWRNVPAVSLGLSAGGAPQQHTTVKGCWDGATLYLAYDAEDTDIRATMTERDLRVWQEEAVEAFIAPYGDPIHYFEFQCSPLNTLNDVRVTNPNARGDPVSFDRPWTCAGWQSAVRVSGRVNDPAYASQGWTVEWAIPLASLLEPGAAPVWAEDVWRVNLFRIDRWPREEWCAWSPAPGPVSFHRPRYFGLWIFE